MSARGDKLQTLNELNRLRPYMNLAELARRTGHHRANIKRWWDKGVDLTETERRRDFRAQLLKIIEESHAELGRILEGEPDSGIDYEYLLGED